MRVSKKTYTKRRRGTKNRNYKKKVKSRRKRVTGGTDPPQTPAKTRGRSTLRGSDSRRAIRKNLFKANQIANKSKRNEEGPDGYYLPNEADFTNRISYRMPGEREENEHGYIVPKQNDFNEAKIDTETRYNLGFRIGYEHATVGNDKRTNFSEDLNQEPYIGKNYYKEGYDAGYKFGVAEIHEEDDE